MAAAPLGLGRSELTHGQVHVMPLAQCSQPVQAPALVVVLQELHEACKEGMAMVSAGPGISLALGHHHTAHPNTRMEAKGKPR